MVELSELPESVGGNSLQLVVGEDKVLERPSQSRQTIWHETVQPYNIRQWRRKMEKLAKLEHLASKLWPQW